MIYEIKNEEIQLRVNTLGAEAVSLICKNKERLWQNENGAWGRHAPVLFPICSSCRMIVKGKEYPIPFHGFARDKEFALVEATETTLRFCLQSNEETKRMYPFDFIFYITYTLEKNTWKIDYEIVNPTSEQTLYVSCGGHESYALDEGVENYVVTFEKDEVFDTLLVRNDGLIDEATYRLGTGKILPIPEEFMKRCAVNFVGINSRKVVLSHVSGKKIAETTFEGFDVFLLWHPIGSKMICIEPWLNLPDDVIRSEQEFSDKYGVIAILPKEKKTLSRTITYF